MTVDSSYNLVTRHPMSFFSFGVLKLLITTLSNLLVSLGSSGARPRYHAATLSCSTNGIPCARTHAYFGHTTIDPPPVNHLATHLASIALVPGGALCTTGRAMLGSALQPLGCMPCISKCGPSVDFCAKPC